MFGCACALGDVWGGGSFVLDNHVDEFIFTHVVFVAALVDCVGMETGAANRRGEQ